MIVKVMKTGGDFRATIGYLLAKQRREPAEILDGNCRGPTPDAMAQAMEEEAAMRPDIAKPCWHAVFSWHAQDKPTDEQMTNTIAKAMESLEIDPKSHSFVAVVHRDTNTPHVHLVVNRVSVDQDVWLGQRSGVVLQTVRRELDQTHGWTVPDGRGNAQAMAEALDQPEASNRASLRGAKHEAHCAVSRAIASSDGTFSGFIAVAEREGIIKPALSFNEKGFNGASFTLLRPGGDPAYQPESDDQPARPYIFKGSQIGWNKDKFEAALTARRTYLEARSAGADPSWIQVAEKAEQRQHQRTAHRQRGLKVNDPSRLNIPTGQRKRPRKKAPFLRHVRANQFSSHKFLSSLSSADLKKTSRMLDEAFALPGHRDGIPIGPAR
jgi:hypothetical protein